MTAGAPLLIVASLAVAPAGTVAADTTTAPARTAAHDLDLPPPQCRPLIRGVLWWIHPKVDGPKLTETLDAMGAVGMNLLWLLGTMPLVDDPDDTLLERIYTEADRRGWRVLIETSWVPEWYGPWDIPKLKALESRRIPLIARRYAHHRSFFGWYINYEIYMEWGETSRKIRDLYGHIGRLVRAATPKAKLSISPFFLADKDHVRADFRYATPDAYGAWWAETLRGAGIDIVMLQDSGAVHAECVTPRTRAAFFAAMQRACRAAGAELWGNVEMVEHRADDWADYGRKLRAYHAAGTPYPWSFDMARNAAKLDLASRFTTNIVSWGWEFWNPVNPRHEVSNSAANYRTYQRYVEALRHRSTTRP